MLVKLFKVLPNEELAIKELQKISQTFNIETMAFNGTTMMELISYLQNKIAECESAIPPRLSIDKVKDEKPIERFTIVYTLNSSNIFGFTLSVNGLNNNGKIEHPVLVEWFITSNVKEHITDAEIYHWNMMVLEKQLSKDFECVTDDVFNYINNMSKYAV